MSNTFDGDLGKVFSSEFGLESKFGPVNSLMICNLDGKEYCGGEQSNTGVTCMILVLLTRVLQSPAMRFLCQPLLHTTRTPGPDDDNKLAGAHCQGTANLL